MKQTLQDYIRQDAKLRQFLLNQDGGIMKFWAEHPDRDFDLDLFNEYEEQLVESYLQANKRNRDVASLPVNELIMKARTCSHHMEKEIHYKVDLQPVLTNLPMPVIIQANRYIDDYLVDAYRRYRRCCYPNGITPLAFYDEVVKQFYNGGLACKCMDYILIEHHHPEVWSKNKSDNTLITEFFIKQYLDNIYNDSFKMLRQAVKEKLVGKNSEESRQEAIKTMNLVRSFSRMIYSSAKVSISDYTGSYIVDKEFLRELTGGNAALRILSNAKVPSLHKCFYKFVSLLNEIGQIWAARLLKDYGIDMHKLERETGAILYLVTKPLQNPDGAVHGNYKYYIDKDFNDPLDDQCCIYDEKQAKELLHNTQKKRRKENLASMLKNDIENFVNNINKNPRMVLDLGKVVAKAKFDLSFMEAIICGLNEEVFMDKAIIVITDAWNKCLAKDDDACYVIQGYHTRYYSDSSGFYKEKLPRRSIKYPNIEMVLDNIKADELKKRKKNDKFDKRIKELEAINKEKPRKNREKVKIKNATHSFRIKLKGICEKEKNQRIATFFADLSRNGKYIIENTNERDFVDNFTGTHTAEKIVWTAEFKQLLYLITYLRKMGVLEWNTEKPKPGIRQMICIVFKIRENEYKEVDGKMGKVVVPVINDIDVSRLNTTIDTSDEGLDPIIRRLVFGEASTEEGVKGLIDTEGFSK